MAREEAQKTREKKHGSNPGTFSPDDDEAQAADISRVNPRQDLGDQRQAQGDEEGSEENIEQLEDEEDEEAEDDEDEVDGTSPRA